MRRDYEALSKLIGRNFAVLNDGISVYLTPEGEIRDVDGKILMAADAGRAKLFEKNLKSGEGGGVSREEFDRLSEEISCDEPYKYLVTDGDGKTVWEDRLGYVEPTRELLNVYEFPETQTDELYGNVSSIHTEKYENYEPNAVYKIVFDGKEYFLEWAGAKSQYPYIGNTLYYKGSDNGVDAPFCLLQSNTDRGWVHLYTKDPGTYTVEVYNFETYNVKKFDLRLMPDEVPVLKSEKTILVPEQSVTLDEYGEGAIEGIAFPGILPSVNVTFDGKIYNIPLNDSYSDVGISYASYETEGVCVYLSEKNQNCSVWFEGYTGEHTLSVSYVKQTIPAEYITGASLTDADNGKVLAVVDGAFKLVSLSELQSQ